MVSLPLQLGALFLVCLVIAKVVLTTWSAIRFHKWAKQQGCSPAANLSGGAWPLDILDGLHRAINLIRVVARKDDIIEDFFGPDFEKKQTFQRTQFDGSVQLYTTEPANMQAILATQFKDFGVGSRRTNQARPFFGPSVFSSDGAFWEHSRALFRPQFDRDTANNLDGPERATKDFITAIGPANEKGWTADTALMELCYCYTLDVATEFLFGQSVGSQQIAIRKRNGIDDSHLVDASAMSASGTDPAQFIKDFATINITLVNRVRYMSLYWLGDSIAFRRAAGRIHNFVDRIVARSLDANYEKTNPHKKYNLIASMGERCADPKEIRSQLLSVLLAGRDTTAAMVSWSFLRMSIHQDSFHKLRAAVLKDFPVGGAPITADRLKQCRYLQHFLAEIERLHPSAPLNYRFALQDTTLPVGGGAEQREPVAVRKGQCVFTPIYLMQRRKDLWGADAEDFRPERWEERRWPTWQYVPFSHGPRICIGQQFAINEASVVIIRMLQRYDRIDPVDLEESRRMRKGLGLTMSPLDGCRVRMHEAAAAAGA